MMKDWIKKMHIPAGMLIILGMIILFGLAAAGYHYLGTKRESKTVMMDQYASGNQILYDEVVGYLTDTLHQEEGQSRGVADTAVENYETIVSSGITTLNRSHTEAVLQNVKRAILENIDGAGQMTEEELDLVASNITEMILLNILTQLEDLSAEARTSKEYMNLYQSINEETAYLSDHEFKITITASVNDTYIDSALLMDVISNMTEEEKNRFAQQLAEMQGTTINPEVLEWLNQIDSIKDLKGEQGIRGERGIQGEKGEKGEQGAKGSDGYTPVKGVDYFTDSDVKSITNQVTSKATDILQSTLGDQVTYTYDPETKTLYINSVEE